MKNPTIEYIAEKAGVSKRVVSVVVNGKENQKIFVSQKKKAKILELVEKYGYVPRKYARELAGRKTNTVGLIFHRLTPRFSSLLGTLQDEAYAAGLEVMPYITKGSAEKEELFFEQMRDGRVDGIIVASGVEGSRERFRKYSSPPYNLKIVAIMGSSIEGVPTVHFDDIEAGKLAAKHLLDAGCENLCFFGGASNCSRAVGFLEYVETNTGKTPRMCTGDTTCELFEEGQALAKEFISQGKIPDGVFASNDLIGVALAGAIFKHGMKIPEDVSIVGCDNTDVCLHFYPSLTSIDINDKKTVKIALEQLWKLIDEKNEEDFGYTKVKPRLVARESTMAGV